MDPISLAVVGTGRRAWGVYFEILPRLPEHFRLAAVCDPLKEYADKAAARFDVPAFTSLRDLARAHPAEAGI